MFARLAPSLASFCTVLSIDRHTTLAKRELTGLSSRGTSGVVPGSRIRAGSSAHDGKSEASPCALFSRLFFKGAANGCLYCYHTFFPFTWLRIVIPSLHPHIGKRLYDSSCAA